MRFITSSTGSANHTGHALFSLLASIAIIAPPCLAISSDQNAAGSQDVVNTTPAAVAAELVAPRYHDTTPPPLHQRQSFLNLRWEEGEIPDPLVIFNYSSNYNYAGCYNDTNLLSSAGMKHALAHVLVGEGYLTAPLCLEWCAHNGTAVLGRPYKFAGLEYSRECYCGEELNPLVVRLEDGKCDTYCDGDNTTACGGANKLSLYNITDHALKSGANGLAAGGHIIRRSTAGLVVLGLGVAVWSSLAEAL